MKAIALAIYILGSFVYHGLRKHADKDYKYHPIDAIIILIMFMLFVLTLAFE